MRWCGKRWHKGGAVFVKGVSVGRSETSDEHIVLMAGGLVLSRTIRRLEPSRRHDAGFLGKVKVSLKIHKMVSPGIGQERNQHQRHRLSSDENTQKHNPDTPDNTEDKHSETAKETDDTNDADDEPMSQNINAKSSGAANTDGVRQDNV